MGGVSRRGRRESAGEVGRSRQVWQAGVSRRSQQAESSRRIQQAESAGEVGRSQQAESAGEEGGAAGKCRDPERERLCNLPFISPVVSGGVTTRSDASSPESCAPIGPWPHAVRLLWPKVVPSVHPVQHGRAAELTCIEHRDINRPATNSWAVFQRLAESRVSPAYPFGHLPALCGWLWSMRLFYSHATWPERSGPCSTPLLGGDCIEAEVRGGTG